VELIYFTPKFSLRRALWASSPIGRRIFFFSSKFWLRRVASGSNEGPYQRCSAHLLWRPVKRFAPQGVICYCILFHSIVSFAIIVFFYFLPREMSEVPFPFRYGSGSILSPGKKGRTESDREPDQPEERPEEQGRSLPSHLPRRRRNQSGYWKCRARDNVFAFAHSPGFDACSRCCHDLLLVAMALQSEIAPRGENNGQFCHFKWQKIDNKK
jgi:hypothetical protein